MRYNATSECWGLPVKSHALAYGAQTMEYSITGVIGLREFQDLDHLYAACVNVCVCVCVRARAHARTHSHIHERMDAKL